MSLRKYTVRRSSHPPSDERAALLRRCYVVVTSDGVLLELGDRVVMRFDSLDRFLRAFDLKINDLRELAP
jgi:hypothetical protein